MNTCATCTLYFLGIYMRRYRHLHVSYCTVLSIYMYMCHLRLHPSNGIQLVQRRSSIIVYKQPHLTTVHVSSLRKVSITESAIWEQPSYTHANRTACHRLVSLLASWIKCHCVTGSPECFHGILSLYSRPGGAGPVPASSSWSNLSCL